MASIRIHKQAGRAAFNDYRDPETGERSSKLANAAKRTRRARRG